MKKLILVNPAFGGLVAGALGRLFKFSYPPVFSILEALTPKDYEVVVHHQPFAVRYEPGLAAITSFTSNARRAYRHADGFRRAGAKVVMGGCHAMFRVEEALEHCDSVVVGEVEAVWKDVLRDYERGELKRTYEGGRPGDFWRRYHEGFLRLPGRKLRSSIQTTRGCRFKCRFCVVPALYGGTLRHVPVDKVVEQVRAIPAPDRFFVIFNDNNIYADPAYARELFKELVPLGIRWEALASVDIAEDEEALRLARRSGCRRLHVGFETVNEAVVGAHPGKLAFAGRYLDLIRRVEAHGIRIKGSFMIGFDEDTLLSLGRLLLFTFRANLQMAVFSVLTPMPGTPLFEEFEKGRGAPALDWDEFDGFHVVRRAGNLSPWVLRGLVPLFRYSFLLTTDFGRCLMFVPAFVLALIYVALH
ncbi:MAG: radical SAM protein [Elusimicrobia bacterium]|nr:radical SAM protein [Elusimicrobiota bacterium]